MGFNRTPLSGSHRTKLAALLGFLIAACVVASLAGCSKRQQAGPQPSPNPTNVTGLPLPDNAVIVDAREFQQLVDPAAHSGSPLASLGKGTYTGHVVIAATPATQAELLSWLQQVAAQPPAGLVRSNAPGAIGAGTQSLTSAAHRYGVDFVVFVGHPGSKGATIVVMDPKTVVAKLGPILTMLETYHAMPEALKQGMDAQVKKRTGVTISELTDRSAPLGAAIAAVDSFRGTDKRAIVLVSAEKNQ